MPPPLPYFFSHMPPLLRRLTLFHEFRVMPDAATAADAAAFVFADEAHVDIRRR